MSKRTFSQLLPDEQASVTRQASAMWARGLFHNEIAEAVGLTPASFEYLTRRYRESFPIRMMGGGDAASDAHKTGKGSKHATEDVIKALNARLGDAFLPLRGFDPAIFDETEGCKWPISTTGANPLSEKASGLCCARPRAMAGDRQLSYCGAHYRLAYVPRAR